MPCVIFMNSTKAPLSFPEAAKHFFLQENGLHARAEGNSMLPFISDGQSVLISPEIGRLRRGMCYFFFLENRFILHRLVRTQKANALFMGDNSDSIEIVPLSGIAARLDYSQPVLGRIIITLINDGYYISAGIFPRRFSGRIRKRLIKITAFFFKGHACEKTL
jgi:hypothetical protein